MKPGQIERICVHNRFRLGLRAIGRLLVCVSGAILAGYLAGCAGSAQGQSGVGNNPTNPPTAPQTFAISGTISPSGNGSGATVTLSGPTAMSTTASGIGAYSFAGLANGTYMVSPSRSGYTFNPGTQAATVNGGDSTGINFTATAQSSPTFTISGTIAPASSGGGATVSLSGTSTATTTANNSGVYSFSGLTNGNYAVSPSRSGFVFTPSQKTLTINGANVDAVNFTAATGQAHSVQLMWTPSASTVVGYNIYRSTVSGSQYSKINSAPMSQSTYVDATVSSNVTYFYVTTAVDAANNESLFSNEVQAAIP